MFMLKKIVSHVGPAFSLPGDPDPRTMVPLGHPETRLGKGLVTLGTVLLLLLSFPSYPGRP